ncbi:dystrophin-related protein 2-like [Astyanax mexicanus]|uniref:dystrophin-related protein 2-like n=1 Tax=Astyanax mexicanus TaxID=7994 RepID=UPI0020CAD13C|nr:dystrophin-related protein 2-like [Astyanax mexicanus]
MSSDKSVAEVAPRLPPRKSPHTPVRVRDTIHSNTQNGSVRNSKSKREVLGNGSHLVTSPEGHRVCGTRIQHSLQLSLQELTGWLALKEADLEEPWPLGGDLKTLQHQRQQHQFFEEELNSRTSFVHSVLEAAQDFLSQHPLALVETTTGVCVEPSVRECVGHTARTAETRWQSVLRRCSARRKRLEDAVSGLEEMHCSIEEIQREIEEAQGIQQAWEPLEELQMETLQDHVDAIGLFEEELVPVKEGLKNVNILAHQLCNAGMCLTEQDTRTLHNLNAHWRLLQECTEERLRELQEALTDFGPSSQHFFSGSVQSPWERAISASRVPYYINHSTQSTSWDHPRMIQLYQSMADLSEIRFSAYRTAMKLRRVQKLLKLDCIPLSSLVAELQGDVGVIQGSEVMGSGGRAVEIQEVVEVLTSLYEHVEQEKGMMVDIPLYVDMCLNWLLSVYDSGRTGRLRLLSLVTGLVSLCDADVKDKCKYLFWQVSGADGQCDAAHLSSLLNELIQIPRQLGEAAAFGGNSVEPSVNSCFRMVSGRLSVGENDFLDWIALEPQSVVWLPVLQRVSQSEHTLHHIRCSVCRHSPIRGFRYRSLKQFNVDICQSCFLSGRAWRGKTLQYPIIEYYTKSTSGEKVRAFAETLKNKFRSKQYFSRHPQRGYLPVQSTVGQGEEDSPSFSPKLPHSDSNSSIEPFACSSLAEMENQNCSFFNQSLDEEQYPLRYYSPVLEPDALPCPHLLKYNHTFTERPGGLTTQPEYSNICADWTVTPSAKPEYTNICMDSSSGTNQHNCHACVKQPIREDILTNGPGQQSRVQLQRSICILEQQNRLLQREYRRLQWQLEEAEAQVSQRSPRSAENQRSGLQIELERRMLMLEEHKEQLETQIQQLRTLLLQQIRDESENSISAGSSTSTCSPGPRPPQLLIQHCSKTTGVCIQQDSQNHTTDHLQQVIEQLRHTFPSESDSTTAL